MPKDLLNGIIGSLIILGIWAIYCAMVFVAFGNPFTHIVDRIEKRRLVREMEEFKRMEEENIGIKEAGRRHGKTLAEFYSGRNGTPGELNPRNED